LQRGIEAVGGWLYLTSKRLIFESHALNIQAGTTVIPLASITGARKCWTKFLNLIPLFPNSFAVATKEGKEYRFVTFGRQAWIDAIEVQKTGAGTVAEEQGIVPASIPWASAPDSEISQEFVMSGTYPAPAGPKSGSTPAMVLGIISLVVGFLGLPLSMIPCLNFLALPFVIVGLLLGIIGFIVAKVGQKSGIGLPIAGMVVSLIGLIISVAWIGAMAYFVKDAQAMQAQEEKDIREGPAITVSAVELFGQYKGNQLDADQKYKDKVLELSGAVAQVATQEGIDKFTVELQTGEADETIDCNFKKDHKEELAKLMPGQQVTIRGKCKGKFRGSVTLEKCILK
jgi:hypothetical protein